MRFRPIALLYALAISITVFSATAHAQARDPWPARVQSQIARISQIGWRLANAADRVCPARLAPLGADFDYIAAYSPADQAYVRQVLRLGDAVQVASVIPGGPADGAGLMPGDKVLAVNRKSLAELATGAKDPDLLADEVQSLTAALPAGRPVMLTIERGGKRIEIPVLRPSRCGTRFLLKTGQGLRAYSDTANVAISDELVAFTNNDDELALILAHELAHILYRDPRDLRLGARRAAEARADHTGAALATCAGYDLDRGAAVMDRLGKRDWVPFFKSPTHGGMKARARRIREQAHLHASTGCPLSNLDGDPDPIRR